MLPEGVLNPNDCTRGVSGEARRALPGEGVLNPKVANPEVVSPEVVSPEVVSPEVVSPEVVGFDFSFPTG